MLRIKALVLYNVEEYRNNISLVYDVVEYRNNISLVACNVRN
jgi:hypothetical protein